METNSKPVRDYAVLFICLGNICRSPAAECIMRSIVRQNGQTRRYYIDSAGIGSWHVGQMPDSRMRIHCRQHGYECTSLARQFTNEDFDKFDYIVVMDEENYNEIARRARNDAEKRKIVRLAHYMKKHSFCTMVPDPYYGGDKDFEHVIELLEDGCEGFFLRLEALKTR